MSLIEKLIFHIKFQSFLPDRIYIKRKYKQKLGVKLNLKNPKTFTDKIQWLKLYDRNSLYTVCADKFKVREFVKERIGDEHLIPILNISANPEEIPFESFPNEYILKANNSSGSNLIVKNNTVNTFENKIKFDRTKIIRILNDWKELQFHYINREWEYKHIKPLIITEKLLQDESGNDALNDFKIHCFHGQPMYIQTLFDRIDGLKEDWYDLDWEPLNVSYVSTQRKYVKKPNKLSEMIEISKKLSEGFKYVRVDLYNVNNHIYFGELTFRPYGGFMKFKPDVWNSKLGELIKLEEDY